MAIDGHIVVTKDDSSMQLKSIEAKSLNLKITDAFMSVENISISNAVSNKEALRYELRAVHNSTEKQLLDDRINALELQITFQSIKR